MNFYNTIILGAGLTGLSVAYRLSKDYLIVEKSSSAGGLCKSVYKDGFTYDYTGHFLHFSKPSIKKFVSDNLDGLKKIEKSSWIFSEGKFTKYPYQMNLYGLSKKTIRECIKGLIDSRLQNSHLPSSLSHLSFYEWSKRTFGRGITSHFLKPYNEKLWQFPLRKLTAEWVGKFVPVPDIGDVIEGAFSDSTKKIGYNASFFYPETGGIQSLINVFLAKTRNLVFNRYPVKIEPQKKMLTLSDGGRLFYENLISTIPLPEFLSLVGLKSQAKRLKWTSVLCFNIGVRGNPRHNMHWVYVPGKDYSFYRVGFYSNINRNLAPRGCYSMYVEVSHRQKVVLEEILNEVVADLVKIGFLTSVRDIVSLNVLPIKYGYAIYDSERKRVLDETAAKLKDKNIYLLGRYGAWKYSYMEESISDGFRVAKKINKS